MLRSLIAVAVALLLVADARAADIVACGSVVPAGETGTLQADLTGCVTGVTLQDRATLEMNGHAIVDNSLYAVSCEGRPCSVNGPGEIRGGWFGIAINQQSPRRGKLFVRNLTIRDLEYDAVAADTALVFATDVVVTNAGRAGVASGCNTIAVTVLRMVATGLSVTDNPCFGVWANRTVRLENSMITGNNGYARGIDLLCRRRPRLFDSTCGSSIGSTFAPWGVCTND